VLVFLCLSLAVDLLALGGHLAGGGGVTPSAPPGEVTMVDAQVVSTEPAFAPVSVVKATLLPSPYSAEPGSSGAPRRFCPGCGAPREGSAQFCAGCGEKLV
jgi:hypothetical protein